MKFRPIRGSLAESMKEYAEVWSIEELATTIGCDKSCIAIELYDDNPDNRIGWDMTCIVMKKIKDNSERPAGFTDSLMFKQSK